MGWGVGLEIPGAQLRHQRLRLNHSQADAARIIGCYGGTVGAWERRETAHVSDKYAEGVKAYLELTPATAPPRATRKGANQYTSRPDCHPDRCPHYPDCVALQHAQLWTLCEVLPPLEADLLRYDRLVQSDAPDIPDLRFHRRLVRAPGRLAELASSANSAVSEAAPSSRPKRRDLVLPEPATPAELALPANSALS
jgi:hypothetical protein